MVPDSSEALIDRIYEAGVVPELWPAVLDGLATVSGGFGGTLIAIDPHRDVRYLVSSGLRHLMDVFVSEGWNRKNTRFERLMPLNYPGFVQDTDLLTPDEIASDPYYTEFLYPNGGGWATGTVIASPTSDHLVFNLERAAATGPFDRAALDRLDALRPHLARAGLISGRLRLERAKAMTRMLQAIGLPGAALRRGGRVVTANALLEELIPAVLQDRRERIVLADTNADAMLLNALQAPQAEQPWSIPVPATWQHSAVIVHLAPVRGAAHDFFASAEWLLIVTPIDRAAVPNAEVLQGLFDLTPTEARIASGIAQAQSVDELAKSHAVSRETIRSQLKAVLSKTGLSRQQELVSLLGGKSLPNVRDDSPN